MPFAGPLCEATLVARRGRFVVQARSPTAGDVLLHLANSGRLQTVLTPGARLRYVPISGPRPAGDTIPGETGPSRQAARPARLTAGRLVLVHHPKAGWVSVDAGVPSRLMAAVLEDRALARRAFGGLFGRYASVKREIRLGGPRLDIGLMDGDGEPVWLIECKSVTMVERGAALFPDAPTVRGAEQARLLGALSAAGLRTAVVFMVGRADARSLRLDGRVDPVLAAAVEDACGQGLALLARRILVRPDGLSLGPSLPVKGVRAAGRLRRRRSAGRSRLYPAR